MTDHIIKAAREAEAYATSQTNDIVDWKAIAQERFYALAYKQGLERAAVECDEMSQMFAGMAPGANDGRYDFKADAAEDCAAAIRAHAQNQPKNAHDGSVV